MNTSHTTKRIIGGALLSGGLAVAGLKYGHGYRPGPPGPRSALSRPLRHRRQWLGSTEEVVPRGTVAGDRKSRHRPISWLGHDRMSHLLLPLARDGQRLEHDLGRR